eukprot:scaffold31102_cov62-Phaeocystis_antarctica.AAC.1
MRGREVGRREVEGSAVRRRRVGMPCGFAGEVEGRSLARRVSGEAVPKKYVTAATLWLAGGRYMRAWWAAVL